MKKIFIFIIHCIMLLVGNASVVYCAWTPILGIPDPPFGITTTHNMYAGAGYTYDYSDDTVGPVPYRIGTTCGPYTHYIDPGHPNTTDLNNPHGTELKPRLTTPPLTSIPAGTVVYIHSGTHKGPGPMTGSGTPAKPIFIRGNPKNPPTWTGVFDFVLDYVVMENFRFDLETYNRKMLRIGAYQRGARTHISIRNNEFFNNPAQNIPAESYQVIRIIHDWNTYDVVQNIVIYNNSFHNLGDGRIDGSRDAVGVSIDINTENIWVIDNAFYQIGGDGVQIASDRAKYNVKYSLPNHIYIGRNTASDMFENFLDLKTCTDIIVSQNTAYNFGPGYGELADGGAAFRYGSQDINNQNQRRNIWTMYNTVYNNASADGAFLLYSGDTEKFSDEIYYIGNLVYNCHNTNGDATAFSSWNTKKVYWYNNAMFNCDRGGVFFGDRTELTRDEKLTVVNNIFGDLHANTANSVWLSFGGVQASLDRAVISNNIYYDSDTTGKIRWGIYSGSGQSWNDYTFAQFESYAQSKVVGSLNADPKHVDPANGNFQLFAGSLAINAGRPVAEYSFDFAGKPVSCNPEIGPYEYGPPPVLSPAEGTIGTQLAILGECFGIKKGKVLIGGVATKIGKDGWDNNTITGTIAKVPSTGGHNYDVTIRPYKAYDITFPNAFTVKPPQIDSLDAHHGAAGTPITITGNFFGTKKGKVYLEDISTGRKKNCKVTSWGMGSISFSVPKTSKGFPAGTYPLSVENKVGIAEAPSSFTIE
jgi:hypothetical protein